ncbi:MAG: CDP-alcohol phosphatidyltransferase family protein, partial [Legionellales bacterium]|nr:CDP-alcohol phosphatidyltransferase family protein [Legionellales bacterium]
GENFVALVIFFIAGLTDCLDGYLARIFSWASNLGAILDPLADKLLMISSFSILYIIGAINIFVPVIIIFRDLYIMLGVVYIYTKEPSVLKFQPSLISKINTVLQLFLIFIILISISILNINAWFIWGVMLIVVLTTVFSLLQYINLAKTWLAAANKSI